MALVDCPECSQRVSDRAIACPHCGFSVSQHFHTSLGSPIGASHHLRPALKCPSCGADTDPNATKCRFCGTHLPPLPPAAGSPSETEFKDHGLQIVGLCERALSSPRMYVESVIADAQSQLDRLRAKHQHWLSNAKYEDVDSYLFCCISTVRMAKLRDDHAGDMHGFGGMVGGIMGFAADLETSGEITRANAYIHDLRIMLGAMPGSPTAVDAIEGRKRPSTPSTTSKTQSEPDPEKVPCDVCGSLILPATATRTGGKCMRCAKPKSGCAALLFLPFLFYVAYAVLHRNA